jgi:hypothetical protein
MPVNVSHEPGDVALRVLGDMLDDRDLPLEAVRRRYREILHTTTQLPMAPMHDAIMHHIIRPLNEAIQCYVFGMPTACIAQSGLVGEMVALWRFRMLEPKVDGKRLDDDLQRQLFGRLFDELRQYQRANILKVVDTFDEAVVQAFERLRQIRNRYLHNMIEPSRDADADAREAIQHATTLVAKTLDMTFSDGRIVFPPKVMAYIKDILKIEGSTPAAGKETAP